MNTLGTSALAGIFSVSGLETALSEAFVVVFIELILIRELIFLIGAERPIRIARMSRTILSLGWIVFAIIAVRQFAAMIH